MEKLHPLVNKFVILSFENFYKYGKIIEYMYGDLFLVQYFLENTTVKFYTLHHINQMVQDDREHTITWQFFDSRRELNKYLKWIETPERKVNNVLQLVSKNENKK
jgi:hypothetical protein